MKSRRVILMLLFAAVAALSGGANGQGTTVHSAKPFFVSFQPFAGPVVPFAGDDRLHVAYQLLLTNYDPSSLRLVSYATKSADTSCPGFTRRYEGANLKAIFNGAGNQARNAPQDPVLGPGQSAVLFVFLDFARSGCIPGAFSNALSVEKEGSMETLQILPGPDTPVSRIKAPIISPPLRGKNWWSPNAPGNDSIHRRALIVLQGTAKLPEEFAVDWVKLGSNGNTFSGDPHANESCFAYRSPIYATSDGTVVTVKDGIPDNRPVQDEPLEPAVPITLETIAGNSVIVEMGGGFFELYAHLIAGTLKVREGQKVHAGDLLGLLGNSGNSTEPHLHFQVMDAPAALATNGVPFVLNTWTRVEHEIIHDRGGKPTGLTTKGSHAIKDQAYMNLDLANF